MKKTILITGASSGIGEAAVSYFAKNNWLVFATMRNTENNIFHNNLNVIVLELDVTDKKSIKKGVENVLEKCLKLDAIINNAGYGGFGAFELSTALQRQQMYDVNVFGVMNVIEEVLPHFRQHKSGTIVNVSSIGGLMTYPLFSIYHSTKWALEGFSESLHFELKQFGIKVKIIEPGATKSNFSTRSLVVFEDKSNTDYDLYMKKLQVKSEKTFATAIDPLAIAKVMYKAVNDNSSKLRYPVGNQKSIFLVILRKLLPTSFFIKFIRYNVEK
jgi:short-subunit dehydrogenase